MGLDMYAYKTKATINEATDFSTQNVDSEEIAYWRKHPNLHGWMENLYYDMGGKADSFNCVNVKLDIDDLKQLKEDIENGDLPQTAGFFFGQTDGSERDEDLEFVDKAIEAINEGYSVYYNSWW